MSRESAQNRIDSLKVGLSRDQYQRTALGNAVRFSTMQNLVADTIGEDNTLDQFTGRLTDLQRRVSRDEFVNTFNESLDDLTNEFDRTIEEELSGVDPRFDSEDTVQQRLSNSAYRTRLGRTIAKATVERRAMYTDANSPFNQGATGSFRAFTNGFVQDDEDFFGSRVLYDNVFGAYEDGGESLTNQRRRSISDPTNDVNRTVVDKVLDNVVNRSIYDQTEIVDRVDTEFSRFHGESMVDQMSMSGAGLRSARSTIRQVMLQGSAMGRQLADRGEVGHPIDYAREVSLRVGQENINANIAEVQNSLSLLNNNLKNRSGQSAGINGGFVNKAGTAEFINLINTAGTRNEKGELNGGRISISSFQFQNETVSAALIDKIQRDVLENVLQKNTGNPLEIDLILAYPRQRNISQRNEEDSRYGVGSTNFNILGPNLIEALKLEEAKNDIYDMLRGLGVAEDDLESYLKVNIEFRDKKFHPKVYLTDNVAGIGTQNLTAPLGNSILQAGSNFETMLFVANKYKDDNELKAARLNTDYSRGDLWSEEKDVYNKNQDIVQSLLYRQVVNAVDYEKTYSSENGLIRESGGTSTPFLNNRRGQQVGFAGDIYQHMKNTLDYAHRTNFNVNNSIKSEVAGKESNRLFMILDQAFMLQLGGDSSKKMRSGEMGSEIGDGYTKENTAYQQYRQQQSNLFDLIIADKAKVVIDTKNFNENVRNPLIDKINREGSEKLKRNFQLYGQNLGLMAGYNLFNPGMASTTDDYNSAMKSIRTNLKRLGFTKEAGFDDMDIKQIIGLASGNIEMAKAPRQHVKSFGLIDYSENESPELTSYYMGSSNLGLYSLGIPTGSNGSYQSTDGDLINTEIGIMLGRRDMNDGTNLSRVQDYNTSVSNSTDINGINRINNSVSDQWSLNQEEERTQLILAQRHLVQTWNQLSSKPIINSNLKSIESKPLWQQNVNTADLNVLKNRLEALAFDLGVEGSAFKIIERYGNNSASGLTSINVTINIAQMLGSKGFLEGTQKLPKLNFELTVLQGPSRGSGMFNDRTDNGNVPGFVYFVDKNKIVGNGIFNNDSGTAIEVLGRQNYNDDFINDVRKGGRITLNSGQSAEMSSLDIVPQMFATLIGEGISRFGTNNNVKTFRDLTQDDQMTLLKDFMSITLSGRADQVKADGTIKTSNELLKQDLNSTNKLEFVESIVQFATTLENQADFIGEREGQKEKNRIKTLSEASSNFINDAYSIIDNVEREGRSLNNDDINSLTRSLHNYVDGYRLAEDGPWYRGSDQLINKIMSTTSRVSSQPEKLQNFKEFQNLMFGSFLQTRDDRLYGGQQGFYRTLLMGVGNNNLDKQAANLMFDIDLEKQGLHNIGAYARFKPLAYNPTTAIHEILYRSVASKSTSLSKNTPALDSMLFGTEARDLGDAANLRLMSSIGIGNIQHRQDYLNIKKINGNEVVRDRQGNIVIDNYGEQQEIFDAMEKSGLDKTALDKVKQEYIKAVSSQFGDLKSDTREDTVRLEFYTGSAKKLSQLPQRIKNAMGARPLYQFSLEAQRALANGNQLSDITDNYLTQYRDPIKNAISKKVENLLQKWENLKSQGATKEELDILNKQIDDLNIIGSKAFSTKIDGLGAIFKGNIKSVLNQEQVNFISRTKQLLFESMEDLIQEGEISEEQFNELLRVEVLKAGLTNKGLGKMTAGSNNMNYSMSIIQLTGTYNDTFLANTLYGTTYKSKEDYEVIKNTGVNIEKMNAAELNKAGIYNLGMTEGYFETQQKSIKGSMMGEGGMNVLLEKDDTIVENPITGKFIQKRKVNGKWITINEVDTNRNLSSISNVIDNTSFTDVGSPTLGSLQTTSYGRKGEESVDYIYDVVDRAGNFQNNEYLLEFQRLRSIKPGSGRRVEGTDSSSLVKGVAFFAGRIRKNINGEERHINVFEDIERQYLESYKQGEIGGSLKAYLDYSNETQRVNLNNGEIGYSPLSSSIQGIFNANNFKSFFWSHGATILRSQVNTGGGSSNFMLDELFSNKLNTGDNAKKLAGALLVNFGTDFISDVDNFNQVNKIKQVLTNSMLRGEYGEHYQKLALASGMQIKTSDINKIKQADKFGQSKADITSNLLFDKMTEKSSFNGLSLAGLKSISSSQLLAVLEGDESEASKLLETVRKGIIDPVAKSASEVGGISLDNHTHRGAALITTAVDLMHQLSRSGSRLELSSDIDLGNDKIKEVLFNIIGLDGDESDASYKDDILEFVNTINTNINAVTVFTDITFSFSKDPTSTQSVAKHEAQHLITPYIGNIQKYTKGGQLDKIQHTVAGLAAMVTGTQSGMLFYDKLARSGFNEREAINLVDEKNDFLFSTFHKQKFLGFYQQGTSGVVTDNYVKAYKDINRELIKGSYEWGSMQTTRNINDPSQILSITSELGTGFIDEQEGFLKQINDHINKFYSDVDVVEKARLQDKFLNMGGQSFALYQMDMLVEQMSYTNARFQADPTKKVGKETTSQFLQAMNNKQMFVSIPEISVSQQDGEIVARTNHQDLISTLIPSANDMRVLGAQYADFVDPILGHYKNLSSIFVAGTQENKIFEKIRLASQTSQTLILSTSELQTYKQIQDSAKLIVPEIAKATAGARYQEAMGGKNKYQGFTSTAIGSFLMPFGSAALSQAKLDEAGMIINKEKIKAMRASDIKIQQLKQKAETSFTNEEKIYLALESKFGKLNKYNVEIKPNALRENIVNFHRKQRAAISYNISKDLEADFNIMKREAIETKNKVAKFAQSNQLTTTEKKESLRNLRAEIRKKRDEAYQLAGINRRTGKSIVDKNGKINGFPVSKPSENNSYIYHAQALNYDSLLNELLLIANEANVKPLSAEHVKELERRQDFIREHSSFALNSREDADGRLTFSQLGELDTGFKPNALFVAETAASKEGTVERHMKAINELSSDLKKVGMHNAAKEVSSEYARNQIDAQIAMYKERTDQMQKFSVEREVHSNKRDENGSLIIDSETQAKIDAAHRTYNLRTEKIIQYLENQKQKIINGVPEEQLRAIFQDIDLVAAEVDQSNLQLAEVFRSPPPGGTDPRLHTYRVMQGVQALNQVSSLLQKQGSNIETQSTKMIYSTERGQTATVMASLGIVTYGGGDWDGDSYTAIFNQAEKVQNEIKKQESKLNENRLFIKSAEKELIKKKETLNNLDPSNPKFDLLQKEIEFAEGKIESRKQDLNKAKESYKEVKADFEQQIQTGQRGLHARARKQLSAYTGIDEKFFVSNEEVMYDVYGNKMKDSEGANITGLRQGATMDADAMFVYMEKGYGLIEQLDSKRNQVITLMNNIDALTGYRSDPKAFTDEGFLKRMATGITLDIHTEKVSVESPAIGLLKDRVKTVLNENQNLDNNQREFLQTLKDSGDETYLAYLNEFNTLTKEMGMQEASQNQHNRSEAESNQKDIQGRAHMNKWIASSLFNSVQSNETLGKFMQQGMGMNLTEGTFDMTLKVLGKAGGEILGKTYNTIISSTFQDAPIITYGKQLLDETNPLYATTLNEFQKQSMQDIMGDGRRQNAIDDGRSLGFEGNDLDEYVNKKLKAQGYEEFESYIKTTRDAVQKSEKVQGFMKNIHQLLRDAIKLKGDTGNLLEELQSSSDRYNKLSKDIVEAEDDATIKELSNQQQLIIEGMSSNLGPGPGLKSLIDLNYLTNEFDRDGISKTEFEQRFFKGGIDDNKERVLSLGASMNLNEDEMNEIRGLNKEHTDDSMALLKIARGLTARNLAAMVTSFQMSGAGGEERTGVIKDFARSHKAHLATAIQADKINIDNIPRSRTRDGNIDEGRGVEDYIRSKYSMSIEKEHHGARFDAHRQHKEALDSHISMESSNIYAEDGITLTSEYRENLDKAAKKLNVSQDEYLLLFDHIMENNTQVINGLWGVDGQKMEDFTTMDMTRKNLAHSMLTGKAPNSDNQKVINQAIGPEIMTTMAQAAAQGKLDSQGMEIFSGMFKGVVRHLLEATDGQIEYINKKTGKLETQSFNKLDSQQQSSVMTKMMYQNLIGTEVNKDKGFSRSTSDKAKEFKHKSGTLIGNSVLELREDGTLGNDFIDALDKAGEGSTTGIAVKQYEAMGEAYLRESLDTPEMFENVLQQYLKTDRINPNSEKAKVYRNQLEVSVRAQMQARQEQITKQTKLSRSKHQRGYGINNRSSFMNNINSDVISQLSRDSRANTLDFVMPLLLTAAGTAISEGSIDKDQIMALGGAAFTGFQYARTGTINASELDPAESKRRIAAAQATSGIFKLKNAMLQHGEENIGAAIGQVVLTEAISVGFNMVATPWLSRQIAEKGLGAGAAPAMNAMDMKKYTAGQQLGGNLAASAVSAISSTLISGLFMKTMQGNGLSISETIQSFLPAAQGVSQVNEAIARRRAQEAAFQDFQAETDGTNDSIEEYMVVTDATYNPNDFESITDLQAAQELSPESDGSLSIGILV